MVRPNVEYATEIWVYGKWQEAERLQLEIGRFIPGHRFNSNDDSVIGELGWWKLQERRDLLRLKYWNNIRNMDENRLVKKIYIPQKLGERGWAWNIKKSLIAWNMRRQWKKTK